jgi:hypothetical protein
MSILTPDVSRETNYRLTPANFHHAARYQQHARHDERQAFHALTIFWRDGLRIAPAVMALEQRRAAA